MVAVMIPHVASSLSVSLAFVGFGVVLILAGYWNQIIARFRGARMQRVVVALLVAVMVAAFAAQASAVTIPDYCDWLGWPAWICIVAP